MAQAVARLSVMESQRVCIHEAGHFYIAYRFRPARAVSICISRNVQTDPSTGEEYVSVGQAVTFDPHDSLLKVQITIRAAGLAAESVVYNESFEHLMGDATLLRSIKTDTDNAKADLTRAGLYPCSDAEFLSYWRTGFSDAVNILRSSEDKLHCIAGYCRANLDRDIPRAELVRECGL